MSRAVPLLVRSSLRYLTRHAWQSGLSVLGVALGVAVMVGVDVANESARQAFGLSTEAVTGRATHQVLGGPSGIPDAVFADLVTSVDFPAAPVVEGWVTIPGAQRTLRVLGVDPFSERPFRPYLAGLSALGSRSTGGVDLGEFLTEPAGALLSAETAESLGVEPGGILPARVDVAAEPVELELLATLEPADRGSREALSNLLVMDVAAAQELLDRVGRLSRIDLIVPEEAAGRAVVKRVEAWLPAGLRVVPAEARSRAIEEMTRAFRLNLTALSLLALLCGMFLIYNTMTFSVVQRRTGIGTLRALGTTRRQVFGLVLGEATLVGLVGTAFGLTAGVMLARGLVRLTTRTINDLYFVLEVRNLAVPPEVLVQGAVLGLVATVATAAVPAWEATSAPPRSALLRSELEARARRAVPRTTAASAVLLALGALLLWPQGGLLLAFAGLFAVLVGCALSTPVATIGLMRLLSRPAGAVFGILGRMAARGVTASLSRTAVAIAALMVAVSVTVGVGIMIDSFRGTVESWLESTLQADLYVAPIEESRIFDQATFGPELSARFRRVEGVAQVGTVRRVTLEQATGDEVSRLFLLAFDIDERSYAGFDLKRGDPEDVWPRFQAGEAVIVSEPFAYRRDLDLGEPVSIPTDRGPQTLPVAGVFYDYASDQGVVLLARNAYDNWFDDRAVSGISVFLEDGASEDRVIERLRAAAGPAAARLSIQSNRELKRASLEIFDRTFRVTDVLRWLAGLVAFIGVLSALMALELERARELGILRANGMTPRQVWKLVTAQTGLMGLAAGALSLPVGWIMASIMIYVINRRSFGWTLDMAVAPRILAEALLLALAAALLAGVYPAWKMARTRPALALREE